MGKELVMTYDPNLNRDKFEEERSVRVNQTNDGSGGAFALAFWIAVLLIGGIVFFMSGTGTEEGSQQVTQNNTAPPVTEPIAPPPAPSAEPPAPQPVTPPANQ
jgi:hypothetical protein